MFRLFTLKYVTVKTWRRCCGESSVRERLWCSACFFYCVTQNGQEAQFGMKSCGLVPFLLLNHDTMGELWADMFPVGDGSDAKVLVSNWFLINQ